MASKFSENLIKVREMNNLSTDEFADKLGTYRSTIWRYEKGERVPDLDFAIKVAVTFNVSLDWLSGHSDEMFPNKSVSESPKDKLLQELVNLGIIRKEQDISDDEIDKLIAVARSLLN